MNRNMRMKLVALVIGLLAFVNLHAQTVQDGLALIRGERYTEAGDLFKKLAEGSPSADNQYYLGYYYIKTDQLDEAQKAFDKGLSLDDKSYLNKVGLGTIALAKGDRAKAKELFDEAEKKKKKDAEVLFRIGEAYTLFEKNNDPAEAIRLLDLAIARDKNLADAYLAKGDALMLRNEGGNAVTAYEYALTTKPNYAAAHNAIGSIYLRGKNYNLALENYKKAIEADANFAPAYKDLAELYFWAQKYKQAAENFDLYLQKSGSTDPKMKLRGAQFAFTADDYAKSLQFLEEAKGKINDPITKRMYGWAYFKTNKPDEAIQNLEEFIKVAPEKVIGDDYKYLGRALNAKSTDGKGYDSLGMEYIKKGAEMDTSKAEAAAAYKEVAGLYYAAKDFPKAAAAYEKGNDLDTAKASANDYYYEGLANFQSAQAMVVPTSADSNFADSSKIAIDKRNLYLKADSIFATVTQKLPEWPYGYYWRASTLYNAYDRQENVDKGISQPYYLKLTELAEKDPDPSKYKSYLRLAYGYLAFHAQSTLKDEAKAKEYWEKLLKVDPDNAAAKEALGLAVAQPAAQPAAAGTAAKPAPKKK
ncbi:Tetratricopeptide TPR_2 repeat protein [Dyadobacter fermentans DSM 18053]|uniref:Tetratricopeptide TPR_2 repeat protein n=1 Tax=Dyadobacter fermentans (strain ATCC 700827 / DSM 18053 / CIP 107007 / KCTC 52180 / NS114) TaxID=471854 RepID=C6VZ58_DYAFD|nr:Tetratricopeptide TPR_2 repeat protein [Dyadobacter fermentans DSM 18053]